MMGYDYIDKNYNYIIRENYYGKIIDIYVNECWNSNGIFSAVVSCPKYNAMCDSLGHKSSNYVSINSLGIDTIINRLTVDDVHDVIFKELEIAEKSISNKIGIEHDNFKSTRYLTVLAQYENQEIPVNLMLKAGDTKVWIIRLDSLISHVSIDKFRDKVIEEVQRGKRMIDNGYVFSKPVIFNKVKRKIKSLF